MQPTDTIPYSDLRKTSRIDLVAHSPLPVPLTIYVEPTNICNFRCVLLPRVISGFRGTQRPVASIGWIPPLQPHHQASPGHEAAENADYLYTTPDNLDALDPKSSI